MVHTRGQQVGAVSPANPGSSAAVGDSVAYQATNVASSGLKLVVCICPELPLVGVPPVEVPLAGGPPAEVPLAGILPNREFWKSQHVSAPK